MNLRYIFFHGIAAITHPIRRFKEHSTFCFTKIKGLNGNVLQSDHAIVNKCRFTFSDSGHQIVLSNCRLYNANIYIRGKGNRLIIDPGADLNNIRVKMIGTGNTIHIGAGASCGGGTFICGGKGISIEIGKRVLMADGIDIWSTDTHSIMVDGELVNPPKSIIIEDGAWIGKDVAVMKGVKIGEGAVIGMRSMVTHDIAPRTLNVGNPARTVRENVTWSLKNPNNE